MLQQYTGTATAEAPSTVHDDFDQVTQVAPRSDIAEGLSEAFRSDQTPAFGQMVSQMFGQSSGQQRAGILNTLIRTLGPTIVAQFLAGKGAGWLSNIIKGGQTEITPEQAEQVPPEAVQDMAAEAEKKDPSIIDSLSDFYSQHPTLIKTLGGAALTIALAKIAQRYSGM
jgi:uncharacterized protein with von Willebrand factor type A (vWA) domain